MKNVIITSLSVLALTMMFTGCGGGSVNDGSTPSAPTAQATGNESAAGATNTVPNNGNTAATTVTNEFGINPELGTPPVLPAS